MKQKNNKNLSAANLQNKNLSYEELSKGVIAAQDESVKEMEPFGENKTDKTYEELSAEFRELYPKVIAAYQLIPLMYNNLRTVVNMSHRNALKKILTDHKDLEGFSRTNVYRALPPDNPIIPRRVVPLRDKSSPTKLKIPLQLSDTKSSYHHAEELKPVNNGSTSANIPCPDCLVKMGKIEELEEALNASGTYVPMKHWQREFQIVVPFRELKIQLIRQSNISGQGEPVLIYGTIDLTSNKVTSFSLGKKPERN